jgi:hypothetical protein
MKKKMNARFSNCHSWAGSIISSFLPATSELNANNPVRVQGCVLVSEFAIAVS